ncbi:MAG: hypothetical protein KDA65_16015 [Planctomycetaceae bacterium]|nr:hypothetical protein [Planctomycetaceae bacterium]
MGLSTVPFIDNEQACWYDKIDSHDLINPVVRWLIDSVAPFWKCPTLKTTGKICHAVPHDYANRSEVGVTTTVSPEQYPSLLNKRKLPVSVTTYLSTKDWVTAMVVELDSPVIIEQMTEPDRDDIAHLSAQPAPKFLNPKPNRVVSPF